MNVLIFAESLLLLSNMIGTTPHRLPFFYHAAFVLHTAIAFALYFRVFASLITIPAKDNNK
jgi:hypothetical protein